MERIEELENDIRILEAMKVMYEQTSLCGSYHSDMMREINLQIADSKHFLKNVKESKVKDVVKMLFEDEESYDLISLSTGLSIAQIKNIEKRYSKEVV